MIYIWSNIDFNAPTRYCGCHGTLYDKFNVYGQVFMIVLNLKMEKFCLFDKNKGKWLIALDCVEIWKNSKENYDFKESWWISRNLFGFWVY